MAAATAILHLLFAYCIFAALVCWAANAGEATKVPAVLVFGDSVVDTGNNNHIASIAKADFPPYGDDFPGRRATGRFSDARSVADYMAEVMGVKSLLPPYLDPSLDLPELLTGVSFASAGAGYDPRTSPLLGAIPLLTQLSMFKQYIRRISLSIGEEEAQYIVSNSAYFTFIGSNDLTNLYPKIKKYYTEDSYTDLMINFARDFYQKLYETGARRIGVMGLPPTGCTPAVRYTKGGANRDCDETLNSRMKLFNSKLILMVDQMNQQLPDIKVVLFPLYDLLLSLAQNPAPYGIVETKRGCCARGNIALGILCVLPGTCANASQYMFFDSFHTTDVASRILTYQAISPSLISKFF